MVSLALLLRCCRAGAARLRSCRALGVQMAWWRERVLPRIVDRALDSAEVHRLRARACAGLAGDVLEVGFGSGLNLAHYPAGVTGVWAVEPSDLAWRMAQRRLGADQRFPVYRAGLDGQRLELPDGRFDAVLSTFTMCTIPDLGLAMAEMRRVLRPGGSVHFVEHGRAPDARVARWQDRIQPIHGRVAGGCHLDRSIADEVRRCGLEVEELDTFYLKGPRPFGCIFLGRAVR